MSWDGGTGIGMLTATMHPTQFDRWRRLVGSGSSGRHAATDERFEPWGFLPIAISHSNCRHALAECGVRLYSVRPSAAIFGCRMLTLIRES